MTDTGKMSKTRRPMSPRRKRYWTALAIAAVLGGILGAWLQVDQPGNSTAGLALITNGPLTANFAIGASILWLVGMLVSMAIYHRSIDDHEQRAWLWACTAGWYVVMFAAPVWWVLHRASLAPPTDAMPLFLASLVVNGVVWLWLKYR